MKTVTLYAHVCTHTHTHTHSHSCVCRGTGDVDVVLRERVDGHSLLPVNKVRGKMECQHQWYVSILRDCLKAGEW